MNPHNIVYLILFSAIILSCGQSSEFSKKSTESKTKLYYLDSISVEANDSSYRNGHFRLRKEHNELFHFSSLTDTTEIFYDKTFLKIAERIIFTLKDSTEHYQRFNKEGNITADYLYKQQNILTVNRTLGKDGCIRVTPSVYTSADDVMKFVAAVKTYVS